MSQNPEAVYEVKPIRQFQTGTMRPRGYAPMIARIDGRNVFPTHYAFYDGSVDGDNESVWPTAGEAMAAYAQGTPVTGMLNPEPYSNLFRYLPPQPAGDGNTAGAVAD